jgi:hypothetical protein
MIHARNGTSGGPRPNGITSLSPLLSLLGRGRGGVRLRKLEQHCLPLAGWEGSRCTGPCYLAGFRLPRLGSKRSCSKARAGLCVEERSSRSSGPLRSLATAGSVAMCRPPRRTWRGPLVLVPSPPTRWPGVGTLLSQIDRCNCGSIGGTGRREPVDRWHPLALPQLFLSK